ncbi:MAG TPA: hypothetical protein V6C76_07210 [Drouetiella sp.]
MTARLQSARALTRGANQLNKQAQQLRRDVDKALQSPRLVADSSEGKKFDLEVREVHDSSNTRRVAPESKTVLDNYDSLMARYKAALAAYLQHRQQVQQHAAEYHAQAQEQQAEASMPPVTSVPQFKFIQTQALQACNDFQSAEAGLKETELKLFQDIQFLMANKKTMPPTNFQAAWSAAESQARSLHQGVGGLHQVLLQKSETIETNMHAKMSQAMRDGDYEESQKVYGENEQNSALLNEETNRANTHTAMAYQFMNELQSMMPGSSAGTAGGGNFVQDDRSLAAEFEQVQKLYSEVQAAAPKFHK